MIPQQRMKQGAEREHRASLGAHQSRQRGKKPIGVIDVLERFMRDYYVESTARPPGDHVPVHELRSVPSVDGTTRVAGRPDVSLEQVDPGHVGCPGERKGERQISRPTSDVEIAELRHDL